MSDLNYIDRCAETKIVGQDSTGNSVFYASCDTNGNLFVKDYSNGPVTPGSAASVSSLIGGQFNTSLPTLTNAQQSAIQLDSSGRIIVRNSEFPSTIDTNYGTVGANTLRTASQIGNATGAADFAAGNSSAQTLRVVVATNQSAIAISAASLPLPTGASTDASLVTINSTLGTINTNLGIINGNIGLIHTDTSNTATNTFNTNVSVQNTQGSVGAGTAATKSNLVGGVFNTSLPTLTNAQQSALQLDSSGRLIVAPTTQGILAEDHNYGTVGANTLRTASQIGNATGSANFGAGATGTQTLRVEANQGATGSAPWLTTDAADGPVSPGTVASKSILGGGQYNSTQPTLTDTQQSALQLDSLGSLRVTIPDRRVSGTLGSNGATITLNNLNGELSGGLELAGSFSGTIVVEGTVNGNQYSNIALYNVSLGYNTALIFTGTGSQGVFQLVGVGSYTTIRVRVSAYTSGSFTATLVMSSGIDLLNVVSLYAPNFNVTAVGNVASGTADSGNGIKVSGIYNSSVPTFINGQRTDLQTDVNGNLKITGTVIANNPSVSQVNTTTPVDATYIGGYASTSPPTWGNGNLAPLALTNVGGYLRTTDVADGPVTPGTAALNSILTGGQYNSSLPTLTTGQQSAIQIDSSGRLIISPTTQGILAEDHNYGTVGANTLRTAAEIGNATGAADFAAGNSSAQTLRVVVATNQSTLPVQDVADGSVTGGTAGTFSQLAGGIFNSTPLALTNGQQSALQLNSFGYLIVAPPLLVSPATQNITIQDTASTTTTGANGQNFITGTPTAGSAASFTLTNEYSVIVQVTGTWTGTLQIEISMDGGTTWSPNPINQDGTNYILNAFTNNFTGRANTVGYTNFRVRAIAAMTGTATVKITEAVGINTVYINNPIKLTDNAGDIATIKAASTAPLATDTALVVSLSPNSSLPLPTGAATSANQSTEITSLQTIDNMIGSVGAGTAGTGSALAGGVFNTALPTLTNGQQAAVQMDSSGRIIIAPLTTTSNVTVTPPALTKGTQGATGFTVQELKDAGRNISNLFMLTQVVSTATETLQSLTGYKSGAAVGATTTPAVVTAGTTYRIQKIAITYIAITTAGVIRVNLRANLSGVVALGSPLVESWSVGADSTTAGTAQTVIIDIPDGMEFAAGTGIGITVQGFGATGTAAAVGYAKVSITGYEY